MTLLAAVADLPTVPGAGASGGLTSLVFSAIVAVATLVVKGLLDIWKAERAAKHDTDKTAASVCKQLAEDLEAAEDDIDREREEHFATKRRMAVEVGRRDESIRIHRRVMVDSGCFPLSDLPPFLPQKAD